MASDASKIRKVRRAVVAASAQIIVIDTMAERPKMRQLRPEPIAVRI